MAEALRVLYLIGQFPALNHRYLLAEIRQLRKLGIEVDVVSVSPPDRPIHQLTPEERDECVRVYFLKSVPIGKAVAMNLAEFLRHPLRYVSGLLYALKLGGFDARQIFYHLAYFAEAVLIGRLMRQRRISHVHANFSATVSLIVVRTFPVTMSWVAHGFGELHDPAATHLAERVKGALFVRSVSHFGISQMMLSSPQSEWHKFVYAPLGVDVAVAEANLNRQASLEPRLLCVGRLAPEKGQSLLLEAVHTLKAQGKTVLLRLAGDGPDRASLEKLAADLDISPSVEFLGWVDPERLRQLYGDTDICVLSSMAEGIPVVLMEAMAMQIACVAPRIMGIPELIRDGIDGLLFTVSDVIDLVRQLCALLDSLELRAQLGRQARVHVARDYDVAQNTKRFSAILREQLQKSTPTESQSQPRSRKPV
ncbi:MAG TPA: glycosyltransferase family 4 protein [Candidatus Solibacter sp.]|nr:glycosyltransferase family 4 protein [Candidatus Solibacter sp.]